METDNKVVCIVLYCIVLYTAMKIYEPFDMLRRNVEGIKKVPVDEASWVETA